MECVVEIKEEMESSISADGALGCKSEVGVEVDRSILLGDAHRLRLAGAKLFRASSFTRACAPALAGRAGIADPWLRVRTGSAREQSSSLAGWVG